MFNYDQRYECRECNKKFVVPHDMDFDGNPETRTCIFCHKSGCLSYRGPHNYRPFGIISDNMGGIQGLQSQADGKYYDSKSAYHASLKAQGLTVVGNDASVERATPKTDEIDWKEAVAETIQQISPTKKGKK